MINAVKFECVVIRKCFVLRDIRYNVGKQEKKFFFEHYNHYFAVYDEKEIQNECNFV